MSWMIFLVNISPTVSLLFYAHQTHNWVHLPRCTVSNAPFSEAAALQEVEFSGTLDGAPYAFKADSCKTLTISVFLLFEGLDVRLPLCCCCFCLPLCCCLFTLTLILSSSLCITLVVMMRSKELKPQDLFSR